MLCRLFGELTHNCEQNVHSDTDSDHRNGVDQTHHHEELGTQHRDQLRLTSSAFQEATTQDTDTDSGAERAQTHHQCASDVQQCVCHFHFLFLLLIKVKLMKPLLMMFLVSNIQIDDGQRHEDERL